jgi:hypothetical protein
MEQVDLLAVLPLNDDIEPPDDEDPDLRDAMNLCLLEILDDDLEQIVAGVRLTEIAGTRARRLAALEAAIERNR